MKPLEGKVALVAGATRGAGRGIATALGEAGATVYCSGRSTRKHAATPGRSETIEETTARVTAAGGKGIAVRTDHRDPKAVARLMARIEREQAHPRARTRPLIVGITDGDGYYYRGQFYYDFVKTSVIRMAFALSNELRRERIAAVALTPGFLRSESMLDIFGVTEANWRDAA